jgi:hypothetical protein
VKWFGILRIDLACVSSSALSCSDCGRRTVARATADVIKLKFKNKSENLERYSNLPPGLLPLLVVCNRAFEPGPVWQTGAFFNPRGEGSQALFRIEDKDVHLAVRGQGPEYLFPVMLESVRQLVDTKWEGLRPELHIPCPELNREGQRCNKLISHETLKRRRSAGRNTIECEGCDKELALSVLLAAFDMAPREDAQLQQQLAGIDHKLAHMQQDIDAVRTMVAASRRQLADLVGHAHAPCPCLFTIAAIDASPLNPRNWFTKPVRLTLWCQYQLKPVHGVSYQLQLTQEWIEQVRPASEILLRMLQVASIAVAGTPLVFTNVDRQMIDDTLRFFDETKKMLTEADAGRDPDLLDLEELDAPRLAQGPEVAALAKQLQENRDQHKKPFGGMVRRFDKNQQRVLWVDPAIAGKLDPI